MTERACAEDPLTEAQFSSLVDEVKADPARRARLAELLREDDAIYDQRSRAATVRMRGWVLLAFAEVGLPDTALLFVLEELDNGRDPYLVAAAARALRSYAQADPAFAPLLMRAIYNTRYHDEVLCLERYGAYADSEVGTTVLREVLASLSWLGSHAHAVLPELERMRANTHRELSAALVEEVIRTIAAISRPAAIPASDACHCCAPPAAIGEVRTWTHGSRGDADALTATVFEDQDGNRVSFGEFFHGRPSVVAFFYTRCNNPQKCSLTIAKLARVQQLLGEKGCADRIRTAAITYDPAFDLPARLRGYGESRGVRLDDGHRMLRAIEGMGTLRSHFELGVNFVGSLVNRHRIEVYVLDADGRIAASFERLQWDERDVVARALALLEAERSSTSSA